jgi:hypothetical protein
LEPSQLHVTFVPIQAGAKPGTALVSRAITSFGKLEVVEE